MAKRLLQNLNPHVLAAIVLGAATILFLLISISAPVVEGNQLFRLTTVVNRETGLKRYVNYGLWGYCIPHIPVSEPSVTEGCRRMFDLEIDDNVISALHTNTNLRSLLHEHITRSFVLYPLATVLTFLTCCGQLWMYFGMRQSGRVSLKAQTRTLGRLFAFGSFAMLVALVSSTLLLVVIAKAKLRVGDLRETYGNIYLEWGNLVWLTVFGTIIHFANLATLFVLRLSLAQMERESMNNRDRRKRRHQHLRMHEETPINQPLPLSASSSPTNTPHSPDLEIPDSPPRYQPSFAP
ncbi:hypothetical protein BKA70DRAFT_470932 [Coprinopsis sp. MPI-PUGE-AT-0042]|nr:hypothetical protein BKA70DRAFT_470932 [Coprinopsis sp. MPI-PUGE-AT-0042]